MNGKQLDGHGMRVLGELLKNAAPGLGFVLLTYEFGDANNMANYISNGSREDCIKFLRETANRLEGRKDFRTPENN